MLLSQAWEKYQADKRIEGYSPLTLKMYGFQFDLLKRYLDDIKLCDITTENLKEYLVETGGQLKPSSLRHRIHFIKSFLKWTHEEGHILKNSAAKLKEPKLGKRIPNVKHRWKMLSLNFFIRLTAVSEKLQN